MSDEYSYVRYLHAKKSVDDRSLNRYVLERLAGALAEDGDAPLRIVEIGAGVGTMLPRLHAWGVLRSATYVMVDNHEGNLQAARDHVRAWAEVISETDAQLEVAKDGKIYAIEFHLRDAFEFLAEPAQRGRFDLLIANAFLDLTHLPTAIPRLWPALVPEGLFWFGINFDGETIFLPEHPLDEQLMDIYHLTMDERIIDGAPSGDSRSGRHLLQLLSELGASLLAAGSSDWVVLPTQTGYPADEAYFLHHLVNFVWEALREHPQCPPQGVKEWVALRHRQIADKRLSHIAHQLDILGRAPRH